jgi:uncharacterized protein (TIGR02265 family)
MFSQAVEGFVRAVGERLDDGAKDGLKALGLDLRKPLEPAYPLDTWFAVMRYGGKLLAPDAPESEQLEQLGRRFIDGYEQTLVGRALLATMRVLGPRRTLERMSRNFRSGNNYTETRLEAKGATDYELWFNQVRSTDFYRGMLMAGLSKTSVRELQVHLVTHDSAGATFRVTWAS